MRAKAVADIQNLQNALNEYMAEYGTYPPTDRMSYMYENRKLQPPVIQHKIDAEGMNDTTFYSYGLVSHLYPRTQGGQSQADLNRKEVDYNKDTKRDIDAKERWAHYLKEIVPVQGVVPFSYKDKFIDQTGSNSVLTINDPWGKEFRYQSQPPYLSYRLWSRGPDGADNTADDISNASQ
jgi:hypothetical protein